MALTRLTELQEEVLRGLVAGHSNSKIATDLLRSEDHIKKVVAVLYHKFGIKSDNPNINIRASLVSQILSSERN